MMPNAGRYQLNNECRIVFTYVSDKLSFLNIRKYIYYLSAVSKKKTKRKYVIAAGWC